MLRDTAADLGAALDEPANDRAGRIAPATGAAKQPRVLMVALEAGRSGPCRLPLPLAEAGIAVAALAPQENFLAHSRFLGRHFPLGPVSSARRFAGVLGAAVASWRPDLVIPCDEQAVALLQAVQRQLDHAAKPEEAALKRLLRASLGDPAHHDALLLKSETMRVARSIGVAVPAGGTVTSPGHGLALAREIGYPVFAKTSFSWAGQGVSFCADEAALERALAERQPSMAARLRGLVKRALGRSWYPTGTAVDVQRAVDGVPAMVAAVAIEGRMLASFAAIARRTVSETGPSALVEIMPHAAMQAAAGRMIEALGATGFIGFDFMLDAESGAALLIECNARPIQICHVGPRIGVDLCAALAAGLCGTEPPEAAPIGRELVALFPAAWTLGLARTLPEECHLDVPDREPALMRMMATPQ